jgi:hypothetical protein
MNLKKSVDEHPGIFFLATLAVGFVAGWGAYSAIQLASGHTSITLDRLKQLEGTDAQDKKALLAKVAELELDRANLVKTLEVNRPTTGNYLRNIAITPKSPAELKIGSDIAIAFDYVLNKGETAHIYAMAIGIVGYGVSPVSGAGTLSRRLTGKKAVKVSKIKLEILSNIDGSQLYVMEVPVEYTFK